MHVRYSYLKQQFQSCDDLWEELRDFVASGDFTLGKPLQEFEENFARLIGSKYAIGVNSGTDAIKLSLKALGVGAGDEVITTPITFCATANSVLHQGGVVQFVDIDPNTLNIDANKIEEKIYDIERQLNLTSIRARKNNIECHGIDDSVFDEDLESVVIGILE